MAADSQTLAVTQRRDGDVARLFEQWRGPLLRYLVCCGTTRDEALDVVQDAFLSLHRHVMNGGARDNLRAWVFRVAHNAALNRRMSAERRLASRGMDAGIADRMVSPADDPELLLLKKERMRRLHAAIRDLTPMERAAVLLRSEGLRYREIGAVLEIGVSTVADHLGPRAAKVGRRMRCVTSLVRSLVAWMDGELERSDAIAMAAHVDRCGECGNRARAIRAVTGDVARYSRSLSPPSRPGWRSVPAAAAAAILILAALQLTRTAARHPVTQSADQREPSVLVAVPVQDLLPVGAAPPGAVVVGNFVLDAGGTPRGFRLEGHQGD